MIYIVAHTQLAYRSGNMLQIDLLDMKLQDILINSLKNIYQSIYNSPVSIYKHAI